MKLIKKISDLKKAIQKFDNIGFIPTMGGLHKGHISLIKTSSKKCNKNLVSIYVNPKQFNKKKDFIDYPREINKDLNILKKLNVDIVFLPSTSDIYRSRRLKKIILRKKDKILCAKYRMGHFEGVIDIMDRFISIIKPKYVFMGEKDYQQFFLVKNYIKKLHGTKFYKCKTIRDKDYIAISTRNSLLNKKNLADVSSISKILYNFKKKITNDKIKNKILKLKKKLTKTFKIKIDYLELRNIHDLKISKINKNCRLFIAYNINKVRLIDNY